MLAWYHLVGASLTAALVTLAGHYWMSRCDRRSRARRVFAESVRQCCEELEDAAIRYWAGGENEEDTVIQAAKIKAALMKMSRFIGGAYPPVVSREERSELMLAWRMAQKNIGGDFETGLQRRVNPEQITLVVGKVTAIRAQIAGMLRE